MNKNEIRCGIFKGFGYFFLIIFGLGIYVITNDIYGVIHAIQTNAIVRISIPFIIGEAFAALLFFAGGVYFCAKANEEWALSIKEKVINR